MLFQGWNTGVGTPIFGRCGSTVILDNYTKPWTGERSPPELRFLLQSVSESSTIFIAMVTYFTARLFELAKIFCHQCLDFFRENNIIMHYNNSVHLSSAWNLNDIKVFTLELQAELLPAFSLGCNFALCLVCILLAIRLCASASNSFSCITSHQDTLQNPSSETHSLHSETRVKISSHW